MKLRTAVIPLVLLTALLSGSCVAETCLADEWQCDDGLCILADGYCDGISDCFDASDEDYCGGCYANEWQCDDNQCIAASGRCDGHEDCYDGSDELDCSNCNTGEFECGDGTCIDATLTCDGTDDCADASDEATCGCNPTGLYVCEDLTEIDASLVCDGTDLDCPDGSDEDFCWVTDCVLDGGMECTNGVCWESSFACDGVDNCGDCSDEEGCM